MTPALLSLLGLLLGGDAPPAPARTEGAEPASAKAAKAPPPPAPVAPPAASRWAGKPIPLPPPPVLAPPAKRVETPIPPPPPAAGSPEDLARGELLLEQKCSKCHDVSWAFAAALSDAQWRGHMKRMDSRPGAAITDAQAKQIQRALVSRRARSAAR